MRSAPIRYVFIVVLVALACRVLFTGLVVGWHRAPIGDEIDYHAIATSLAAGDGFRAANGYPTARRPPLYPLVLAAVYRIAGPGVAWGRILQVLLGAAIVALVFLVARRFFSPGTAVVAAAICAVNPYLIFISAYLLTENLYIVILLVFLSVVPHPRALENGWRASVTAGLLLGLATASRPTALVFALWVVGCTVFLARSRPLSRITRGIVVLLLLVATLLPWAARNAAVFGRWTFLTTHGGTTFYQGNNPKVLEVPQYRGGVAPLGALPGYSELEGLSPHERDAAARRLGLEYIRANKGDVPLLLWNKFARMWRFKSDVGMSGIRSGWWWSRESLAGNLAAALDVGILYALLAMPLFILGLILTFRDRDDLLLLYGIVIVHTLVGLVFFGSLRMRLPVEPVIALFAAEALVRVVTRFRPVARDVPR